MAGEADSDSSVPATAKLTLANLGWNSVSDLEQNATQENVSFSGTVFHSHSCGLIPFLLSVTRSMIY